MNEKLLSKFVLVVLATLVIGCQSRFTAEASGEVTDVSVSTEKTTTKKKDKKSGKTTEETKTSYKTKIYFSYTVDGKNYSEYAKKDNDVQSSYPKGSKVVVCYNPKDPQDSVVFTIGSKCG